MWISNKKLKNITAISRPPHERSKVRDSVAHNPGKGCGRKIRLKEKNIKSYEPAKMVQCHVARPFQQLSKSDYQ